jgi:hypothetical protein
MVLLVDGAPVRFALFNLGFDIYYRWVAALYYDGSGPADWLDRLAGAGAIVALNPLDRFAFPAADDARTELEAFARHCAAERFGLDRRAFRSPAKAVPCSTSRRAFAATRHGSRRSRHRRRSTGP